VAVKQGAKRVYAVDVGSQQLHHSLRKLNNVQVYEHMNFKDLTSAMFIQQIDFVLADVSFISLTFLINKLEILLPYKHFGIFLIKPEFELSASEIKKNRGLVTSPSLRKKAVDKIRNYAMEHQYKVLGLCESPIKGNKMGNTEYLIYLERS
jgi:23S rRNA (cytidine1920-2'-O)/16S rRNA (cytidine1409-2'-O)-methyltransferase